MDNIEPITSGVSTNSTINPPEPPKKPKKVRKGQSEEAYLAQKTQFHTSGPLINTDDWLDDKQALKSLDANKKTDKIRMLHACEKAYYDKNYQKCLEFISIGETLFGIDKDEINPDQSTKKAKKKVDRDKLDLLYIKEKCLQKLS